MHLFSTALQPHRGSCARTHELKEEEALKQKKKR